MNTSPIRVLLCEDDPNLGKLLSDYLNAKGFATTWAQDGAEGLKLFHRETFDFIILDVMTDSDSLPLCERHERGYARGLQSRCG
jgi:DNA-binding response OmpR family regulator